MPKQRKVAKRKTRSDSKPSPLQDSKIKDIQDAVSRKDLQKIRSLGITRRGFVTNDMRRICWPLLVRCHESFQGIGKLPKLYIFG